MCWAFDVGDEALIWSLVLSCVVSFFSSLSDKERHVSLIPSGMSVSSTNKTVEQTLDGTKLGLGLKKDTGFGFVKLEYSETDYDDISVKTSNNTKVTADIDTEILALSVAKSF